MRKYKKHISYYGYITVYYNPHKNEYYYTITSSTIPNSIGYVNSYDHVVILVIPQSEILEPPERFTLRNILKNFLQKVIQLLENSLDRLDRKK